MTSFFSGVSDVMNKFSKEGKKAQEMMKRTKDAIGKTTGAVENLKGLDDFGGQMKNHPLRTTETTEIPEVTELPGAMKMPGAMSGHTTGAEVMFHGFAYSLLSFVAANIYYPTLIVSIADSKFDDIVGKGQCKDKFGFSDDFCDTQIKCLVSKCDFFTKYKDKMKKEKEQKGGGKHSFVRNNKLKSKKYVTEKRQKIVNRRSFKKKKKANNIYKKLKKIFIINELFKNRINTLLKKYEKKIQHQRKNKKQKNGKQKKQNRRNKIMGKNESKHNILKLNMYGGAVAQSVVKTTDDEYKKMMQEYIFSEFDIERLYKLSVIVYIFQKMFGGKVGNGFEEKTFFPKEVKQDHELIYPWSRKGIQDKFGDKTICLYEHIMKDEHTPNMKMKCCKDGEKCMTMIQSVGDTWKNFINNVLGGDKSFQIKKAIDMMYEQLRNKHVNRRTAHIGEQYLLTLLSLYEMIDETNLDDLKQNGYEKSDYVSELLESSLMDSIEIKSIPNIGEYMNKLEEDNETETLNEMTHLKDIYEKLCGAGFVYGNNNVFEIYNRRFNEEVNTFDKDGASKLSEEEQERRKDMLLRKYSLQNHKNLFRIQGNGMNQEIQRFRISHEDMAELLSRLRNYRYKYDDDIYFSKKDKLRKIRYNNFQLPQLDSSTSYLYPPHATNNDDSMFKYNKHYNNNGQEENNLIETIKALIDKEDDEKDYRIKNEQLAKKLKAIIEVRQL